MESRWAYVMRVGVAENAAGQDARAAETGRLAQDSHGQEREEERLPDLVQTSQSAASLPSQFLPPSFPTFDLHTSCYYSSFDDPIFASAFDILPCAADQDGAGSMLVASSSELQHYGSPQNDSRDASHALPPASPRLLPNMEVATDATAQDAPAVVDSPMPDAPADLTALEHSNNNTNHNNHHHHHTTAPTTSSTTTTTTVTTAANGNVTALSDGVSLLDPISVPQSAAMDDAMDMAPDFPMQWPQLDVSDERLTAFARLRFDDGSYYMHTYQIILGRNIDLARRDMRRLAKVDQLQAQGQSQAAEALLKGNASKKKKKKRTARSVISEKGGIVSAPVKLMPVHYHQRRQSNASQSLSSGSHPTGDRDENPVERVPQNMLLQAFPEVPEQFDGHVPEDPQDCPLVPIHPQHVTARTGTHGPKGISREHAKVFFDFEQGHFSIQVLGSNGLYHKDEFKRQGEVVPLTHGDHLAIGAVNLHFYLPDVALTEEQRQLEPGSRPMSFSFENGHGELESDEQVSVESEGEISVNPRHVYHVPVDSEMESDDAMDEDEDDVDDDDDDDDKDEYEEPAQRSRHKKAPIKVRIKMPAQAPPKKHDKAQKRKQSEVSPDDIPLKRFKKQKETHKEPVKDPKPAKDLKATKDLKESRETKVVKEPKEPKDKGKAPAKAPSKTTKDEEPKEPVSGETLVQEKPEQPPKSVPNDSPPVLRKPLEGELEAGGEIEGLITEEMARHHNLPSTLIGQVVEKRKGPGRPPKDGIMSKRQRSQLIKQVKEIERAKAAGIDPADLPIPSMKPKITKRKDSNAADGEDGDIRESTENGDGLAGDRKQIKPSKPPRTPSPEPRMEDYTEEQLQRPTANYVVLIHEAISSSSTGQMNLQQIYNYIERKYPWYKFKTTTSGWQSSVRHNLGQHDAFVKGDKEGKGFNWKVNQEVSIEKERRKRQISPPVNHAQRPAYYPPQPNGYAQYPQPPYTYHQGMPQHAMPPATPRLPPSLANTQPRLPPSIARESSAAAQATAQSVPHPSPYASPWAGANTAGSSPAQKPPTPYPPPGSQNPPTPYPPPGSQNPPTPYPPPSSQNPQTAAVIPAGQSGQYGVLLPYNANESHSGPPVAASPYGGPYTTTGPAPNPYAPAPTPRYAPYPPQEQQAARVSPYAQQSQPPSEVPQPTDLPPRGRYLPDTDPDLIRQLEAFRRVYLEARKEIGEDRKVDNAIRAFVDPDFDLSTLTPAELSLLEAIKSIEHLAKYVKRHTSNAQGGPASSNVPPAPSITSAGTAAARAADAVANSVAPTMVTQAYTTPVSGESQTSAPGSTSEPHKFTPNMTAMSPVTPATTAPAPAPTPSVPSFPPTHRPSVEPLTPDPGSPVVQNGSPLKRSFVEIPATSALMDGDAKEPQKVQQGGGEENKKAAGDAVVTELTKDEASAPTE